MTSPAQTRRPARPPAVDRLSASRAFYGKSLALVAVLHAVLYLVDPSPRFFFGDSAAYLASAERYTPPDRSWTYGPLVAWLTAGGARGGLAALVVAQVGAHVLATLAALVILARHLRVRRGLALGVAVVMSVLPAHMLWTRYVMTEAFAMAALSGLLLCVFEYLRSARAAWLLPLHVFGIAAIALRTVMVPPVWLAGTLLPVLVGARRSGFARRHWGRAVAHLAVSLACIASLHLPYRDQYAARRSWTASLPERAPPAYSYEAGQFMLGWVAPIVRAGDFPADLDGAEILATSVDVGQHRARNPQRFAADGLVAQLGAAVAASAEPGRRHEPVAASVARRAVARDPAGAARLGLTTAMDFLDADYLAGEMRTELGLDRDPPLGFAATALERYGVSGVPEPPSLLQRAYLALQPYFAVLPWGLLLVPLALLRAPQRQRSSLWLLAAAAAYFGLAALYFCFSSSTRFMLPFSWLLPLVVAARWGAVPAVVARMEPAVGGRAEAPAAVDAVREPVEAGL
ncbi:MAG: hypothetical protein AAF628_04255 [Planctomycetota bacterium]